MNELLTRALSLSREERWALARELLHSLGEELPRERWDEAWGQDLIRRVDAMWSGKTGVPADEVIETLQTRVSRCAHGGKH